MRTLIDGYNVMHAAGLMARKFGPDGFQKARTRFLNDLVAWLDPVDVHMTTVVFDANDGPGHLASSTLHKGITVYFAVSEDSADEKIEDLIAAHPSPKSLTVVSSDHRIQRAANRKKARVLSADAFLTQLDTAKERKRAPAKVREVPRAEIPTVEESEFWLEEFREVVESAEAREIFRGDPSFPTDEELARIEREVEEEFRR